MYRGRSRCFWSVHISSSLYNCKSQLHVGKRAVLHRAEELCSSLFCNQCSGPAGANDNHYCLVASVVVDSPQGGVGDTICPEKSCCYGGSTILCIAPRVLPSHRFFLRGQRPKPNVVLMCRGNRWAPTEPGSVEISTKTRLKPLPGGWQELWDSHFFRCCLFRWG